MLRLFLAQCSAKRQALELQVHATNTQCAALNSHNERIAVEIAELRVLVRVFLLAISSLIVKHTHTCGGNHVPFHYQPPCPLSTHAMPTWLENYPTSSLGLDPSCLQALPGLSHKGAWTDRSAAGAASALRSGRQCLRLCSWLSRHPTFLPLWRPSQCQRSMKQCRLLTPLPAVVSDRLSVSRYVQQVRS